MKQDRGDYLDNIKNLINLEPSIQEKIKIYRKYRESLVVKVHRNSGLWAIGRTDAQIAIDREISTLESINTKQPRPITTQEDYDRFSTQKNPDEIIKNIFLGNGTSGDEWLNILAQDNNHKSAIVRCVYGKPPVDAKIANRLEQNQALKVIEVGDSNTANLFEHFDACYDFINKAVLNKKKILIHCAAGSSRSPTFVAAYLIRRYGLSVQDALNHLKNKRPIVDIKPTFRAQLEQYAQQLNDKYRTASAVKVMGR